MSEEKLVPAEEISPLPTEMLKSEVIQGYGALGLKMTNHTGNAYTVKVCDRPGHKCETVSFSVSAQNHNSQSAYLIAKIRYLNAQGQYGSWINWDSTMVAGRQDDNYVNVFTGPAVGVGPSGVGGTGNSCAQILYTLTRGSANTSISFQINKLPRGTYGDKSYSGSSYHKPVFVTTYEDEVGPGDLSCCGYRKVVTPNPSNCDLISCDWVYANNDSYAKATIKWKTKGWHQGGTMFWTMTTHEFIS